MAIRPRIERAATPRPARPRRPPWLLGSLIFGVALGLGVLSLLLFLPHLLSTPSTRPTAAATAAQPAVAQATVAAPATTAAPTAPAIRNVDCWFAAPPGHTARCGTLSVPERRDAPSRMLQLRFAVLRHAAAVTGDPVVYISGGPGEPTRLDGASISYWWSWIDREPWLQTRELVLFDQRGVGMSEPAMDCPELADAAYRVLGEALPLKTSDAIWADAAARCHTRLAAAGIDLPSYTTAATVADLESLLSQLGYRSPILLASSYGTRVALRFAADSGTAPRALILDAVDPPEALDYTDGATDAAAAFARLFENCAADALCQASFPDLAASFQQVIEQAAATPLRIAVPDPRGGTLTVRLDDAKLIETLFYAFYDWRRLEELPAIITALAHGDAEPLKPLVRLGLDNYDPHEVSLGFFLSVECHDNFFANPRAAVECAAAAAPLFRNFALSTLPLAACPSWPSSQASAAERAPLTRDIPVLMLVGELDPATPPQWATSAAAHLPHAYVVKFRGIGHGVLSAQSCASRIVDRFLADLSSRPTDDCLLALGPPHFRKLASVEGK